MKMGQIFYEDGDVVERWVTICDKYEKKKEKTSAATTALFTALRSANYNTTLQKKDITLVIIATPTPHG